jgi:hypothetical protein
MELNGRYDMQLGSRHVKGMAGGECRERMRGVHKDLPAARSSEPATLYGFTLRALRNTP